MDWPKYVLELVDHLKMEQFHALSISGGSPYVLVCAKEIPRSRLLAAPTIDGAYPFELGTEGMFMPLRVMMYLAGSWVSSIVKSLLKVGNWERCEGPKL